MGGSTPIAGWFISWKIHGKSHLEMDDNWGYPYDSGNLQLVEVCWGSVQYRTVPYSTGSGSWPMALSMGTKCQRVSFRCRWSCPQKPPTHPETAAPSWGQQAAAFSHHDSLIFFVETFEIPISKPNINQWCSPTFNACWSFVILGACIHLHHLNNIQWRASTRRPKWSLQSRCNMSPLRRSCCGLLDGRRKDCPRLCSKKRASIWRCSKMGVPPNHPKFRWS